MEKTLEVDDFLDIGMQIGLLFDALANLLEERLIDKLLDAAHREVRHKVLPVAKVAEAVESIKNIFLELIERLGLVFHPKPKHPGRMVAAKKTGSVEVHGKRMMPLCYLLAGLDDLGNVLVGGIAHEFQGEVYLVGFAPVDVATFMLQIALETLREGGKLRPDGNRDG